MDLLSVRTVVPRAALLLLGFTHAACTADNVGVETPAQSGVPETTIVGAPQSLALATKDANVAVPCATCHVDGGVPFGRGQGDRLAVHADIMLTHGRLSCFACHDQADRSMLHLADGTVISAPQTMALCGQCHGPQKRDYDHGSHGGMTGYWDASKGNQVRNHCVLCHDPHAPATRSVRPAPGPADANRSRHTNDHR